MRGHFCLPKTETICQFDIYYLIKGDSKTILQCNEDVQLLHFTGFFTRNNLSEDDCGSPLMSFSSFIIHNHI